MQWCRRFRFRYSELDSLRYQCAKYLSSATSAAPNSSPKMVTKILYLAEGFHSSAPWDLFHRQLSAMLVSESARLRIANFIAAEFAEDETYPRRSTAK